MTDSATRPIRVLLVDDHALVRDTLGSRLTGEPDIEVIGAAADAQSGFERARTDAPDVLVLDVDMPGLASFEAARRLHQEAPQVRILFLSAYSNDHYIQEALKAKAKGYVTKSEPFETVLEAIRRVAAGRVFFSDEVAGRIIAGPDGVGLGATKTRTGTLTARELEVLRYLAQGLSKKKIAELLGRSLKTIEGHVQNLMSKLDIHDRVELARYAIREGLVEA